MYYVPQCSSGLAEGTKSRGAPKPTTLKSGGPLGGHCYSTLKIWGGRGPPAPPGSATPVFYIIETSRFRAGVLKNEVTVTSEIIRIDK